MAKKFEYKVIDCPCYYEYEIEGWLNQMGEQGWELIDTYLDKYRFKREK